MKIIVETLDGKVHDVKSFDCGKPVMDDYLANLAEDYQSKGIQKTWVAVDEQVTESKKKVFGYFTLTVKTIKKKSLMEDGSSLPNYPTPVTLLARLAVDKAVARKKLGTKLLFESFYQALRATENGLPTYALILDVLDDDALQFYQKFAFFKKLDGNDRKLFVPITEIRLLLERYQYQSIAK